MGYFRKRTSRHRCALQVARALARQSSELFSTERLDRLDGVSSAVGFRTYLRFAVGRTHWRSCQPLGVFQAAYELRDAAGRGSVAGRMLRPLFEWFGENLRAPDVRGGAIFWFKSDASDCISRIWEIVHVLRSHDHLVWMTRNDRPGRIVYEDAFQVAAVPFRGCPGRRRPV